MSYAEWDIFSSSSLLRQCSGEGNEPKINKVKIISQKFRVSSARCFFSLCVIGICRRRRRMEKMKNIFHYMAESWMPRVKEGRNVFEVDFHPKSKFIAYQSWHFSCSFRIGTRRQPNRVCESILNISYTFPLSPFDSPHLLTRNNIDYPRKEKKLPIHGNEQKDDGKKGEYNQWEKY